MHIDIIKYPLSYYDEHSRFYHMLIPDPSGIKQLRHLAASFSGSLNTQNAAILATVIFSSPYLKSAIVKTTISKAALNREEELFRSVNNAFKLGYPIAYNVLSLLYKYKMLTLKYAEAALGSQNPGQGEHAHYAMKIAKALIVLRQQRLLDDTTVAVIEKFPAKARTIASILHNNQQQHRLIAEFLYGLDPSDLTNKIIKQLATLQDGYAPRLVHCLNNTAVNNGQLIKILGRYQKKKKQERMIKGIINALNYRHSKHDEFLNHIDALTSADAVDDYLDTVEPRSLPIAHWQKQQTLRFIAADSHGSSPQERERRSKKEIERFKNKPENTQTDEVKDSIHASIMRLKTHYPKVIVADNLKQIRGYLHNPQREQVLRNEALAKLANLKTAFDDLDELNGEFDQQLANIRDIVADKTLPILDALTFLNDLIENTQGLLLDTDLHKQLKDLRISIKELRNRKFALHCLDRIETLTSTGDSLLTPSEVIALVWQGIIDRDALPLEEQAVHARMLLRNEPASNIEKRIDYYVEYRKSAIISELFWTETSGAKGGGKCFRGTYNGIVAVLNDTHPRVRVVIAKSNIGQDAIETARGILLDQLKKKPILEQRKILTSWSETAPSAAAKFRKEVSKTIENTLFSYYFRLMTQEICNKIIIHLHELNKPIVHIPLTVLIDNITKLENTTGAEIQQQALDVLKTEAHKATVEVSERSFDESFLELKKIKDAYDACVAQTLAYSTLTVNTDQGNNAGFRRTDDAGRTWEPLDATVSTPSPTPSVQSSASFFAHKTGSLQPSIELPERPASADYHGPSL